MRTLKEELEYDKKDFDIYFMLIAAPLLLSLYYYFGYGSFLKQKFAYFNEAQYGDAYAYMTQFAVFFVLMFIIPALYLKFKMKADFGDYGLGLGNVKAGLKLVAVCVPIILVVLYFGTDAVDVRTEYPLAKSLHTQREMIIWYHLAYVFLYYTAWEFFFRGFLLYGLKDRFGVFYSILIQSILSCLIHLGKPASETIGALFIGILFGIFAYRTRSIWYVFILHIIMGLSTDLYIIYFHGAL
ncbi:MAG: type II CAAX endopeptidase family protein [Candidatus Kapabacteria bacterium]|nr:type II CAAX endopeptidase family protein [Candidatus Kapabacteria bacterium]